MKTPIGILGAGRMGRGIALHFAFAGHPAVIVDLKQRTSEEFAAYAADAKQELSTDLDFLAHKGLLDESAKPLVIDQIHIIQQGQDEKLLGRCDVIFEAVPEVMKAKQSAFEYVCEHVAEEALIASTSSTFAVGELAAMVTHPQRFMNAHWLNPAHLIPLVEIARGKQSSDSAIDDMKALLESVDKIPVICSDRAGYIVPRLQCLLMNEAARMVEEGVASAEDIDKAILAGFGPRYATLGVLEFVDWGGGDIVYYASRYLKDAIHPRYEAPAIIEDNMAANRRGLRDGVGFYDYRDRDIAAYREQRLGAFVDLLSHRGLLPKYGAS